MLAGGDLPDVLRALPRIVLHGPWFRAVSTSHHAQPLWPHGASNTGGRYTLLGGPPTHYLASDQITALAEVNSILLLPGRPAISLVRDPWSIIAVDGVLEDVIDLTDTGVLASLHTSRQELTGEWQYSQEIHRSSNGPMPPTQLLGQAAFDCGMVLGLRTFSAKNGAVGTCLTVFHERLASHSRSHLEVLGRGGVVTQRIP